MNSLFIYVLLFLTANDNSKLFCTKTEISPQLPSFSSNIDTTENPFQKYLGEWEMKDGIFETNFKGEYNKNIGPKRSLVASSPTNNSVIWNEDMGDATAIILWAFDKTKKEVYHLSANSTYPMAHGTGTITSNSDIEVKLFFAGECETCYRMYRYKFISDNEFFFRATYYKDGKETGDYYGATLVKKN